MGGARPCLLMCSSFLKDSFFDMNLNVCNTKRVFCMCITYSKLENAKFPYIKVFQLKCYLYLYIPLLLETMAVWDY